MNLAGVDLNLLLVLHTVLTEGSVTRAARTLHLTQSAVSSALARARDLFADPLLVKKGRGLTPTQVARQLAPLLDTTIAQISSLVQAGRRFEPQQTTRLFTMACSHHVEIGLLPKLMPMFVDRMPRARMRVVTVDYAMISDGLSTGEIDLLIGAPPHLPPGCAADLLFAEEMVCVARKTAGRAPALDLEGFLRARHIQVALQGSAPIDGVDEALAALGRAREIAVSVAHHTTAVITAARTDLIATVPRQVMRSLTDTLPVRLMKPPLEIRGAQVRQIWSKRLSSDPALEVLRALVRRAAAVSPEDRA